MARFKAKAASGMGVVSYGSCVREAEDTIAAFSFELSIDMRGEEVGEALVDDDVYGAID